MPHVLPRSGFALQPNACTPRRLPAWGPRLPLGGHVAYRRTEEDATPSGLRRSVIPCPRVAAAATPGLEVVTASRYLIRNSLSLCFENSETTVWALDRQRSQQIQCAIKTYSARPVLDQEEAESKNHAAYEKCQHEEQRFRGHHLPPDEKAKHYEDWQIQKHPCGQRE